MLIFRATNYKILKHIYPHLVEDGEYNKDIISKEICSMMMNTPNDICVSVVFNGDELIGYTIGWTLLDRRYVWLGQSWLKVGVNRKDVIKALDIVESWAIEEHNIHEIRFETERNGEAVSRAWGFNVHGYLMNKLIKGKNE